MKYNKAYLFGITLVATLGGFLFGYDTGVISGANDLLQNYFDLSPAEIGFVVSSALIGCMIGSFGSGVMAKKYGRKKSLILAAVLLLVSAIGSALPEIAPEFLASIFSFGLPVGATKLVIFRLIGGIGVGLASAIAPIYIAELAPSAVRGKLVSINQLAIVLGFVVVFFVNYFIKDTGASQWNTNTAWRYMFGSECIPAVIFLFLLLTVPFSPRWLMMQGKKEKALMILTKINTPERAKEELAEIQETLDEGDKNEGSVFSFPKIGLILTIGIALSFFQQITGINAILYYGPRIFESMNLPGDIAMVNQIIVGLAMMVFTIVAIFTVEKFGRKPLLMVGTIGMGICIFTFGFLTYAQNSGPLALISLVGYIAFFSISQGPIVWVYLSELFPNKVRGVAMSVAVFAQWLANYIVSQTFPMLADKEGQIYQDYNGAFPFWLYGIFCIIAVVFIWALVPETKGKSLEQIEKHWTSK